MKDNVDIDIMDKLNNYKIESKFKKLTWPMWAANSRSFSF